MIKNSEILLVIGSKNSSNSNRLKEIAENEGKPTYLIDGATDIQNAWLNGVNSIGVTAGASAPEVLVQAVVSYLMMNGGIEVIEVSGARESVNFPVPEALRV
jgi:4-hydroxy-3-methylbut-2-enyl diphosphate reductase